MKLLPLLIVPATLAVTASLAAATPTAPTTTTFAAQDDIQEIARGNVKSINAASKSFVINSGAEGAKDVTVTWNDTTVFMLDGKVVKWDEVIKDNANLTVTHKKGVASKVEGASKK